MIHMHAGCTQAFSMRGEYHRVGLHVNLGQQKIPALSCLQHAGPAYQPMGFLG